MKFSLKFLKKEKHKESANKEANNEFQKDDKVGTFEDKTNDSTNFMSISLSSSDESIAPSTSKQTETVQSKSVSKYSIQKKKEINKKFSIKRRFARFFVPKSKQMNLDVKSSSSDTNWRKKNSKKGVNKKFKVNNLI
jgi:hypothetical protein